MGDDNTHSICIENEKDTRIEPCGHLICSDCLAQWRNKDASQLPTCPFCRHDIQGFEKITIQKPSKKDKKRANQIPPTPPTSSSQPTESEYVSTATTTTTESVSPVPPSGAISGAVNLAFEPDPIHPRSTYNPRAPPPIPPRVSNSIETSYLV